MGLLPSNPFGGKINLSHCYRQPKDATDAQIDALVYSLYRLTEEEIGIVEGVQRIRATDARTDHGNGLIMGTIEASSQASDDI